MRHRCFSLFALLLIVAPLLGQTVEIGSPAAIGSAGGRPGAPSRVVVEAVGWNTGVSYQYDGAGNIKKIGTDAQVYDAAGRLVQSDVAGYRQQYTYDGFGNRLSCASAGTDCQYAYGIDRPQNKNRMAGVSYSLAGNVTGYGGMTIDYDAMNMPVRKSVGANVEEYVYTADDERIAVYDAVNNWRWSLRDPSGKVLRDFTSQNVSGGTLGAASWTWSKDYIYRDGLLVASRQIEPGLGSVGTYHYHLDHLGTPRRITNNADAILGVHDDYAFGPEAAGGTNCAGSA
jgi:YD repeat-containing protein